MVVDGVNLRGGNTCVLTMTCSMRTSNLLRSKAREGEINIGLAVLYLVRDKICL